jgi:hypothetical protein
MVRRARSLSLVLSATEPRAQDFPARIAIALERLRRARAQQSCRCGACAVAHGGCGVAHCDGCAVLSVVASRASQRLQRRQCRVQWGSVRRAEWPERPPVPRPQAAPALPRARSPVSSPSQAGKAFFGAKWFHSLSTSLFRGFFNPARQSKPFRMNIG